MNRRAFLVGCSAVAVAPLCPPACAAPVREWEVVGFNRDIPLLHTFYHRGSVDECYAAASGFVRDWPSCQIVRLAPIEN